MRFTSTILAFTIAIVAAKEAHARRRHLNGNIKGEESDASMSMSMLSPARGGGSKSKSATGAPTSAPIPEVCSLCLFLCCMKRRYDDDDDIKYLSNYSNFYVYDNSPANAIL